MNVDVIVPTLYGVDEDYAKLCIESLLDTTDWHIYQVVNNAPEYSVSSSSRITKVYITEQGQCKAVNYGVEISNAESLFVTNSDMYYAPHWNDNLRFYYPCFSPNLIEPTDNNGSAPPFLKFNGGLNLDVFQRSEVDKFVRTLVDESTSKTAEQGFNLPFFIKRDLWDLIGGYDEKYDPWGSNSDTDLQTKIELAGVQPIRLRDVFVWHFSNKSGTFGSDNQEYWWRNWNYYKEKWGFTRDDEPIPDTWYARDMVNQEKNHYHPSWEGEYE
jgi:hypothetical protein